MSGGKRLLISAAIGAVPLAFIGALAFGPYWVAIMAILLAGWAAFTGIAYNCTEWRD